MKCDLIGECYYFNIIFPWMHGEMIKNNFYLNLTEDKDKQEYFI